MIAESSCGSSSLPCSADRSVLVRRVLRGVRGADARRIKGCCGIAHPFFGTARVIEAVHRAAPDWASKGEVTLRGTVRDQDGCVVGFARAR